MVTPFESHGIEWLVVVGQNTTCNVGQIWDFGKCKVCESGKKPDDSKRRCNNCPIGYAGVGGTCNQCSDGSEPNPEMSLCVACASNTYSNYNVTSTDSTGGRCRPCKHMDTEEPDKTQSQCVCKPGSENFGRLLRFHPTMQAQVDTCIECDKTMFPLGNVECPGGSKLEQHIHPVRGWWMASLESQQDELTLIKSKHNALQAGRSKQRSISETLYPCDESRCLGVRCRTNMTGMLCATCTNPHDVKYNGICVPECADGGLRYWALLFGRYIGLALLLRWKSGDLDAQIDGAVISHLTFFGQTLYLLGQFGHADMFGFRSLILGRGGSNASDVPSCHWTLSIYGDFYVTAFVVPAFQAIVLVCVMMLEQGKVQPIPQSLRASRRSSTTAGMQRTSSGKLSQAKATFIQKTQHKLVGATKLDFFQNPNKHRSQDAKLSPQGMWWLLCADGLESKLKVKGFHRTLLEVLMFSYMGITKVAFSMMICRSVESNGKVYSLSVVDSSESCDSNKFMLTRFIALGVFALYSVGFPLVMILRTRPEGAGSIRSKLGSCKRKVLKKSGAAGEVFEHVADTVQNTAAASTGGLVALVDGASGGMVNDIGEEIKVRKKKCCERVLGDGRLRPAKFDTWCRVTNIFNADNKGWMAMLLWRRALLVFCYTASSASGGKLYLPSGFGVDYRLLPFLLIVLYVILQAHSKPFGLQSDNTLEQCVLMALLLVIFADIALDKPIFEESDSALKLKSPIVAIAVITVLSMIVMHKHARKEGAALARVGMR